MFWSEKQMGEILAKITAVYENRSTRQPNQFELRLHYPMSFAHKLTLIKFSMKSKISPAAKFGLRTLGI